MICTSRKRIAGPAAIAGVIGLLIGPVQAPADASAQRAHAASAKSTLPAATLKRCKPARSGRLPARCRYREAPGRVIRTPLQPFGIGGVSDQYLPWDNGVGVRVTQGPGGKWSHFYSTTQHGWDFGLPNGARVRAARPGVVIKARWDATGWGNAVVVRSEDGSCSRYAHLSAIHVREGQPIGRYAHLGNVGSSGNSTGPHLHFQRENCSTVRTLPSSFAEAGVPGTWAWVVSANAPEPPPTPQPEPPKPVVNPQPDPPKPQPTPQPPNPGGTTQPDPPRPQPTPQPPNPTPAPQPAPRPVFVYHVYGTCRDGACGLKLRAGPGYTSFAHLRSVPEGAELRVVCQARGERVSNGRSSSAVWNQLEDGVWAADFYTDTPNVDAWSPPIPQC